ncbi:MAG: 50S ribosomal protein L30 [Armatimonadetes bacterium]|nr:50S ribosomal protein L30 [Armatimonadota bacterium]
MLRIKLVKSVYGNIPKTRQTVAGLGLKKPGSVVYQENNSVIRGMIHKVKHLLEVTEVDEAPERKYPSNHIKARTAKVAPEAKPAKAAKAKAPVVKEAAAEKPAAPKKKATKKTEDAE